MTMCFCCLRRGAELCTCVFSTCRGCLFCLTHCSCSLKGVRYDPAKLAGVDPCTGTRRPPRPFADLVDRPVVVKSEQSSSDRTLTHSSPPAPHPQDRTNPGAGWSTTILRHWSCYRFRYTIDDSQHRPSFVTPSPSPTRSASARACQLRKPG